MTNKKQKYIITLLVDNREWNSQPIEGELGDLQSIIDEAFEQGSSFELNMLWSYCKKSRNSVLF